MMKKYLFALLLLGPLLSVLWIMVFVAYLWLKPYSGPPQTFVIKAGEPFSRINHRLKEKGLISAPRIFHKLAKWRKVVEKFKPGTYEIPSGVTMSQVMDQLLEGSSISLDITVSEGKNIFEIANILQTHNLVPREKFLAAAQNRDFIESLGIKADRIEGYLYPDTYKFEPQMSGREIISLMVKNFFEKIRSLDLKKSPLTLHQLIILSSIVEKETGKAEERAVIAGVFHNRLKKGMRLQSDPTTIYGIYEQFNGNLKKKHLLQKTPYNTYKIKGLPAGPIANPGLEAIRAVLNPQKHNFFYFVSKNDGSHTFSSNYKDHLKAVNIWQKNRQNRNRSKGKKK